MKEINGMTIYCDTEDYEIVPGSTNVQVMRNERVIANFGLMDDALKFIERRTNPKEVRPMFYSDICRCGWAKEGWDYVTTNDIVFERCNKCARPLRMIAKKLVSQSMLVGFSLDDFINGD